MPMYTPLGGNPHSPNALLGSMRTLLKNDQPNTSRCCDRRCTIAKRRQERYIVWGDSPNVSYGAATPGRAQLRPSIPPRTHFKSYTHTPHPTPHTPPYCAAFLHTQDVLTQARGGGITPAGNAMRRGIVSTGAPSSPPLSFGSALFKQNKFISE